MVVITLVTWASYISDFYSAVDNGVTSDRKSAASPAESPPSPLQSSVSGDDVSEENLEEVNRKRVNSENDNSEEMNAEEVNSNVEVTPNVTSE